MIVYDEKAQRWYNTRTGQWCNPPAEDEALQSPFIGIALLLFVLWLAYVFSGSPQIIWVP